MTPSGDMASPGRSGHPLLHIIKEGDAATSVVSQPLFPTVPF